MDQTPSATRALVVLGLFSIAFGYIEGAVVVYLRQIYYPEGFRFPVVELPLRMAITEVAREAATLVVLWGASWLAARDKVRRFGAFAFCFGIWDLAYYGALKAILNWPATWFDWDILFLIPAPWVGPVITPMLVAVGLCVVGGMLYARTAERRPPITRLDWLVETAAGIVVLASFLWNAPAILRQSTPESFPWALFAIGYLSGWAWFIYRWLAGSPDSRLGY